MLCVSRVRVVIRRSLTTRWPLRLVTADGVMRPTVGPYPWSNVVHRLSRLVLCEVSMWWLVVYEVG